MLFSINFLEIPEDKITITDYECGNQKIKPSTRKWGKIIGVLLFISLGLNKGLFPNDTLSQCFSTAIHCHDFQAWPSSGDCIVIIGTGNFLISFTYVILYVHT